MELCIPKRQRSDPWSWGMDKYCILHFTKPVIAYSSWEIHVSKRAPRFVFYFGSCRNSWSFKLRYPWIHYISRGDTCGRLWWITFFAQLKNNFILTNKFLSFDTSYFRFLSTRSSLFQTLFLLDFDGHENMPMTSRWDIRFCEWKY